MTLAELQRVFHDAVTGSAPLASARELVHDDAGLAIYANAYFARLHDVLVADYPKLHALLGSLRPLVVPYLRAFPTRHPSLREAGAHLAAFLDDPLHVDLARLERARVEAFDGPDAQALSRDELAALAPEHWPDLPLRLVPTATVIEMTTNADEVWDAIEDDRAVPDRASTPRRVIVWRRDVVVLHRTLDDDEHLAPTFGEVCEQVGDVERALALLLRWLDAGVLSAGDATG